MRDLKSAKSDSASGAEAERSRRPHHAKLEIVLLLALLVAVSGCNGESPTAPRVTPPVVTPPVAPPQVVGGIFGFIYKAETNRLCVVPAQIEIIAGPGSGTVIQQDSYGCDEGSQPNGSGFGFQLNNLPFGARVTLRASAPGYVSEERDAVADRPVLTFNLRPAT